MKSSDVSRGIYLAKENAVQEEQSQQSKPEKHEHTAKDIQRERRM